MSHLLGARGFAADSMVMSHEVVFFQAIGDFEGVSHDLGLSHTVAVSGTVQFLDHDLGLSHSVEVVTFGPVVHNLNMQHWVYYRGPVEATASSTMTLSHRVALDVPVSVTQNLNLSHVATDTQVHDLGITHGVMAYLNADPHFEHDLGISHSVQVSAAYTVNPTHSDVVDHAVTFYIDDGTNCPYNDFQFYGTLGEKPFTSKGTLTFTNITGTDDLVVLRNPELDDRDRVSFTKINRESQGGELQVYRDPTWPLINVVQGTVIGLKKQDVDDWLSFMEDHLGEEISMADWHGRYWRGIILNPGEPVVEDTRDRWTLSFEFEGVEMDGPDVIQQVGLSHTINVIQELTRDLTHSSILSHSVEVFTNQVLHNGDDVFYKGDKVIYSG
jgi:hypothetical protein